MPSVQWPCQQLGKRGLVHSWEEVDVMAGGGQVATMRRAGTVTLPTHPVMWLDTLGEPK